MQALTKFCFQLSFLKNLKRVAHRLLLPFLTCLSKSPCNSSIMKDSPIHLNIAVPVITTGIMWLTVS